MSKFLLLIPLTIVLLGLTPDKSPAQGTSRSIAGKITSFTGSPIPNAKLTLKNLPNGATRDVVGNDDGTFIVSDLVPAKYEITAVALGFSQTRATVTITAYANQVAGIILYPIKDTGQSVSGVINSKSVSKVPLNGRSASDLAALEPGVDAMRQRSISGMQLTGGRERLWS